MARTHIRVEDLRPSEAGWDGWLERAPHDIFHSAGFHAYAEASGEGEAHLLVVGGPERGMAWPYLLRPIVDGEGRPIVGLTDITSVYGYPGPLAWGWPPGDPLLSEAWAAILDVWRSQHAVTAFTRFHPLLGNASLALGLRASPDGAPTADPIVAGGPTVSVDLTLGLEGVRAAYGRDLRREIARSRDHGLETAVDVDWQDLGAFARLYDATMRRLRATDYYLFQESHFRRLREALGGRIHLLVARFDGEVAAAGLFTVCGDIAEWYLVGTDARFVAISPSKALVDFAVGWAADQGAKVLHLGGGRGGVDDSLLWFKGRFSPRRHTFHTGRWTLDPATAARLTEARQAGLGEGEVLDPGYFPAYRALPVPAAAQAGIEGPDGPSATTPPAWDGEAAADTLKVAPLTPADAADLGRLLPVIDATYFHPHPMTASEAIRICGLRGRDVYLIGRLDEVPVAYGMLRGANERASMPSLAVGVRRDLQGHGYGRQMLEALHEAARRQGASDVRARVHPDNARARSLGHSLGYEEVGADRHELVLTRQL